MIYTQQFRACDVHRLVDYDCEPRLCSYCSMCDAWICLECNGNWPKRIKAAIKRKLEPGYSGQANYTDLIEAQIASQGATNERAR